MENTGTYRYVQIRFLLMTNINKSSKKTATSFELKKKIKLFSKFGFF